MSSLRRPLVARTHAALAVVAGVAALAVAGCGSDSGGGDLTHAQLVSKANAACQTANTKVAKVAVPKTQADLATYATQVGDITDDLQSAIGDLNPPKQDTAAVGAYVAGLKKSNDLLDQLAAAAKKNDVGLVKALSTKIGTTSVGVLAARAGLGTCATALAPSAG